MTAETGPAGNYYDKFNTTNPIARTLMNGFRAAFTNLFTQVSADVENLLEVGCGEGYMLDIVAQHKPMPMAGIDVDIPILQEAVQRRPEAQFAFADGHHLPYPDKTFDFTMACEVLEHVHSPDQVMAEIKRVTRGYCVFSVPREPIWRGLNMIRGKYIADLGNTPGHIQHWTATGFESQVAQHFSVIERRQPLPWTMILCKV